MNIIQLGMGGMGDAWIHAVLSAQKVRYAAFVEINAATVKAQQQKHPALQGIPVFSTLAEAVSTVKADGVVAVIPPQFRIETAAVAFNAGLPILAEKPLAFTLADAQKLVKMTEKSGLLYMVAQDYRYKETMQTLKNLLDSGAYGAVNAINITHFVGMQLLGFHSQMPHPLLHDMSIHHFDLLRFFLGSEPETIYGQSWNPPWSGFAGNASAMALFGFPAGVKASYHASWVSNGMTNTWDGDWRFECEKGVIIMQQDVISAQKRKGIEKDQDRFYTYQPPKPITLKKMRRSRQAYLIDQFYEAVTTGSTPPTVIQDNLKSLQMVFDVMQSAESGKVIKRTPQL